MTRRAALDLHESTQLGRDVLHPFVNDIRAGDRLAEDVITTHGVSRRDHVGIMDHAVLIGGTPQDTVLTELHRAIGVRRRIQNLIKPRSRDVTRYREIGIREHQQVPLDCREHQ